MRVLYLTQPVPDAIEDSVYDGLVQLLGYENVIDWPVKETFHQTKGCEQHYLLDISRHKFKQEDIVPTNFDAVILGSVQPEVCDRWLEFFDAPIAVLHGGDNHYDPWPYAHHKFRFWREFYPEVAKTSAVPIFPLSCCAMLRICNPKEVERDIDVSYIIRLSHKTKNAVRERFGRILQKEGYYVVMDEKGVSYDEYIDILNRSKISVSVRGGGWDTVRYWEIPYHGALLASQKVPITIRNNFTDGENAIFFESPSEMITKIKSVLSDPERLEKMRQAGKRWSWTHHTSIERARYVLDTMGLKY